MAGGDRPTRKPKPYEESAHLIWTERAYDLLIRNLLHGEVTSRDSVISARVWGACPCCDHDFDDRQPVSSVSTYRDDPTKGVTKSPDSAVEYANVDVTCPCQVEHPRTPKGKQGCGASFRVKLPVIVIPSSGSQM